MTGAGSFRRWLGCAPTNGRSDPALPLPQWSTHRNPPRVRTVKPNGTTLRPSAAHRPRRPRDLRPAWTLLMKEEPTRRTLQLSGSSPMEGLHNICFGLFFQAQPNGVRLSCGAKPERSQIEDYLRDRGAGSFRRLLGGTARGVFEGSGSELFGLLRYAAQISSVR